MKKFLAEFILFYWENYIYEDWDVLTKLGRVYYFIPWFVRAIIMWAICPIAIPEFFWKKSKTYKKFLAITGQTSESYFKHSRASHELY